MRNGRTVSTCAGLALGVWAAADAATTLAACYELTDLGTLGGRTSYAFGMNDDGTVVGKSENADGELHAFLWRDGTMIDLGTLGGTDSMARGVNVQGQVVGRANLTDDVGHRAFRVEAEGVMEDLSALGHGSSFAFDINDAGQVTGGSWAPPDAKHHAFFLQHGNMADLGTFGGDESFGYALNAIGQVTGEAQTDDGRFVGFLWNGRILHPLETPGRSESVGYDINDRGQVAGHARNDAGHYEAARWTELTLERLGTLGGGISHGYGINEAGDVVGSAARSDGTGAAVLWRDGLGYDLDDLLSARPGPTLHEAWAIDDQGRIAAWGRLGGDHRAFLLTPGDCVALTLAVEPIEAGTTTATVTGAAADEEIFLLADAVGPGRAACPPQIGDRCLGLSVGYRVLDHRPADAAGTVELAVEVPETFGGGDVRLQAVAIRGPGGRESVLSEPAVVSTH